MLHQNYILLLESPCSLVRPSVTKFQQNFSAQYLGNEKSYRRFAGVKTTGFSRAFWIFQKIKNFGFLDFWIFGFLAISRQRKELPEIRWCQNDRIFEDFLDFPKNMIIWIFGFLDFCIFWISGYISATKRATRNPLVSKRLDFWILDFWIFLDFLTTFFGFVD